jgi:hypothetical protein
MSRLVIGGQRALGFGEHQASALNSEHHLVLGILEVRHVYQGLVAPGREHRRLIDQVGEIGAGHPRRPLGDHLEANV